MCSFGSQLVSVDVSVHLLDYCNSLLSDNNCDQMDRLLKIQKHAAEVVFFTKAKMNTLDHLKKNASPASSQTKDNVQDSHPYFPFL